jgi:hypothetical protein
VGSMTADEKKRRANEARRLLDEPLLKEAFDTIERDTIEAMLRVPGLPVWADRKRRRLADQVNTIRVIRSYLEHVITAGKQAEREPSNIA